jgi:prepilin-type N-terminal cleavage/methylation domain-containing protein
MTATISRMRNREDGFTLIELMIVMVVLGILAGIIIFALDPFQGAASDAKDTANTDLCKTATAAAEAYNANHTDTKDANDFVDGGTGC